VGAVAGLIAHHPSGLSLAVEAAILLALVAFFGWIWLRERRRRTDAARRIPEMRD
jgi:cyanate permease